MASSSNERNRIRGRLVLCRQEEDWDCGIACLRMILGARGEECTLKRLKEDLGTESIWTIDLAYLLHRHMVPCEYYTVCVGVDPKHSSRGFYRDHIDEDEARVKQLFSHSQKQGLRVWNQSCDAQTFGRLLGSSVCALVLVDRRKLVCEVCGATNPYRAHWEKHSDFIGHFVLATRLTPDGKMVEFIDPGLAKTAAPHSCRVTLAAMQAARTAEGTDEDVVFVRVGQSGTDRKTAVGFGKRGREAEESEKTPLPTPTRTAPTNEDAKQVTQKSGEASKGPGPAFSKRRIYQSASSGSATASATTSARSARVRRKPPG